MRRGLAQLLPEGHQSIEKRSCKQPDSNARPKHQNVSFSAHYRSVWGVLSLVLLTTGNVGPSSSTKCSASGTSISLIASSSILLVSPQAAMPSKSIHLRQRSRATRAVAPHCGHTTG